MIKDKIMVFVPHKIVSEANNRDHWTKKKKRKDSLQVAVAAHLLKIKTFPLPCIITLERIGKRLLDDDNLAHSFKHVRDMIAKIIIERIDFVHNGPIGCYDGDPRLTWKYEQRTQKKSVFGDSPLGFYITIESNCTEIPNNLEGLPYNEPRPDEQKAWDEFQDKQKRNHANK